METKKTEELKIKNNALLVTNSLEISDLNAYLDDLIEDIRRARRENINLRVNPQQSNEAS